MSAWLPVILQSMTLIGIIAILIALINTSARKSESVLGEQFKEIVLRSEAAIGQLSGKQEAFGPRGRL